MNLNEKIIRYYNYHQDYYRRFWHGPNNLSIHYGFWDSKTKNHNEALWNMNRFLANKAKIKPKDVVLDAGCGIGGSSIWIAKNIGAKAVGISICKKQIRTANRHKKENDVDHLVDFYVRDFTNTKFKSKTFDVVWGLESVCYAENKGDFISESWRILKNKGRLIVADAFLAKKNLTSKERKMLEKFCLGLAIPNITTIKKFKDYLKESGFRNIKFLNITKNIMPSSLRLYKGCGLAFPLVKVSEWLKITPKILTDNVVAGINQYYGLKKKIGVYGVFYAEK